MLKKLLYKLTANLPCRLIDIAGKPYLERYYLGKLFGHTCYLHRFVSSDDERNIHDHPWALSVALVLTGGYSEERLKWFSPDTGWHSVTRKLFPGKPNIIRGHHFHRITKPKPETWTLFIHSKRVKGWGFLTAMENSAIYQQPYDVTATKSWHKTAQLGRDISRVEFTRKYRK